MKSKDEPQERNDRDVGRRWLGVIAAGVSVTATVLLFWIARRVTPPDGATLRRKRLRNHIVDDRGTGQDEAARILRHLRDRAFDASAEKLALALGRSKEQVAAWEAGLEIIDDDAVMKARGIAMHRGIAIE